ncbi:MAG: FemAB family PEP-CTERM system-associated protein [Desulfobacula sp.]|nr:FemAB family PEP-CTERM system-associated protein [Desulfobacula sp.]MBT4026465.1 FemAB family PEP-CTERM system-associated protein [Desulfobacula sp.]MBT4200306.1 FemAB family PEP-CTERM system-associated protein [Desulfobacula sp.]MBT4508877.1 FemAB family PEP-CTERM system-associated protein [Desulfobacula sp.]MBT5546632.1 FemAB family PEP-CTERM system-associated protein [Desulfobacula sp.]
MKYLDSNASELWDKYVYDHPGGILYHLFSWKRTIEKTYGHKTYYLAAFNKNSEESLTGILPLIHLKHFIFGNSLISMPFFDMGGILADNEEIEKALLGEAIKLGKSLNVDSIELRHSRACPSFEKFDFSNPIVCTLKTHKVRMLLKLPESSEILMKSFKSKLRSQIKKPIKEGLESKIGGLELLDEFYKVFLINMRDLGSPVHSKKLLENVLEQFKEHTRILIVHKDNNPYAASIVFGFKDTLENPWSSSLQRYRRLSPNMLLYWTMLEYACDSKYKYFDFGRSTPEEGTYRFKQQWGAQPEPLHWNHIHLNGKPVNEEASEKSRFNIAIQCWQKLPVTVTGILGPMIRKNIGL